MEVKNIYSEIQKSLPEELIESIVKEKNCKIERIISKGHKTPVNKWYDQNENEFVLLLKGNAQLLFEDNSIIKLNKGDYINIPAHVKHKVKNTSQITETIWLTVFY